MAPWRRFGLAGLAAALLIVAPGAAPSAADRASPAARAADLLERDGAHAKSAAEAVVKAEQAARAAARAAAEAASAAALAKEAAARAEAAAEAARRAHETARSAAGPRPAPSAVDGWPIVRGDGPPPAAAPKPGAQRVLRVGPLQRYRAPSEAAEVARDGDVIEIEGASYPGDVAVWFASNLVIRGVNGRPHIAAAGQSAEQKAIWVVKGNNTTIEGIEFSGARVPDHNGAGIRLEGRGLTVRDCYFHGNEMGLLTNDNAESDVVIEGSEFAYNTVDYERHGSLGHNIYIGSVRSFTLKGSFVHHAFSGHNVKSRARVNRILYNRLMDGIDGRSSYVIDLPDGGDDYLIGNLIQQGRDAENWSMINFGSRQGYGNDRLHLLHNTLVSDRAQGQFIQNRAGRPAVLVNNILVGRARPVEGPAQMVSNLIVGAGGDRLIDRVAGEARRMLGGGDEAASRNIIADWVGFRDRKGFDYRLMPGSPAIDAGADPAIAWDGATAPDLVYEDARRTAPRPVNGRPDIGAYEFTDAPGAR